MNFTVMNASEHIEKDLDSQSPNDVELHGCINELIYVFRGGKINNYLLFEYVVFHMLVSKFEWTVFKDGQGWVERDFEFRSNEVIASYEDLAALIFRNSLNASCLENM